MNKLTRSKQIIKSIVILLVISLSNVAIADGGSVAVYKGTMSGEWSGDIMGVSLRGTSSISISADGTVSGSFSGVESGTISGTVSAGGTISAKGSAGFSEWIGKLSVSEGRLSGNGSWKGYGGEGLWSSK